MRTHRFPLPLARLHPPLLGLGLGLALGVQAPCCWADRLPVTFRPIAFTGGDTAPGTASPFTALDEVVLNDRGDIAFLGSAGTTVQGVWKKPADGPLELVALRLQDAPDLPGATLNQFNEITINERGTVAFIASLFGVGALENDAILVETGAGDLRMATREGDQAPLTGEPGPRYLIHPRLNPVSGQRGFLLNDVDDIAFYSNTVTAQGSASGSGVFRESSGVLETAVIAVYPGTRPAPIDIVRENPTFNHAGDVATVVDGDAGAALLPNGPGQDMEAPGTGGALFQNFSNPVINAQGDLAFAVTLKSPPGNNNLIDGSNNSALYVKRGDTLTLVARGGQAGPGSAFSFASLSSASIFLNAKGDVVFQAGLTGAPNDGNTGYWIKEDGQSLRKVFLSGDPAPGAPDYVMALGGALNATENLVINARGHVAFLASMRSLTGGAQDIGLFVELGGTLALVTKTGDTFELAPGDFRTITNTNGLGIQLFGGTGNEDGRRSGFNNRDQPVVRLAFAGSPGGQAIVMLDDLLLNFADTMSNPQLQLLPGEPPALRWQLIPDVTYFVRASADLTQPGGGYQIVLTVPPAARREQMVTPLPGLTGLSQGFVRLEFQDDP